MAASPDPGTTRRPEAAGSDPLARPAAVPRAGHVRRGRPGRLAGAAALLRTNALYRRYAAARLTSTLGTTVAPLGLAWAVIEAGGGAGALSAVLLARPMVFLAVTPVAGVLADRLPRRRILITCQLVNAAAQGVAAGLVAAGAATVAVLAVLALLSGAATAFFHPAMKSAMAQVVEPGALVEANALIQIASNVVAVVGPVLAGFVIATGGPQWVLGFDGLTYAVSALVFLTFRLPALERAAGRARFWADLTEGWSAFAGRRWLWVLTVLGMITSACWAGITVLGPIYAVRHLDGAVSWGIVTSAIGVGLGVGSVTALLLRPARVGVIVCAAALPEGLLLVSMAVDAPLPVIAIAAAATGVAGTLQLVTWTALLQAKIPSDQLSRVVAADATVGTLLVPVAYALVGPLAEVAGLRPVLWGCAVLVLAGAAVAACTGAVRQVTSEAGATATGAPTSRTASPR